MLSRYYMHSDIDFYYTIVCVSTWLIQCVLLNTNATFLSDIYFYAFLKNPLQNRKAFDRDIYYDSKRICSETEQIHNTSVQIVLKIYREMMTTVFQISYVLQFRRNRGKHISSVLVEAIDHDQMVAQNSEMTCISRVGHITNRIYTLHTQILTQYSMTLIRPDWR